MMLTFLINNFYLNIFKNSYKDLNIIYSYSIMTIEKKTTKKYIGNVTETTINVFKTGKKKDLESKEVRKLYKEMTKKILKDDPKARLS